MTKRLKPETGRISDVRADEARTARSLLKWVRKVNPKAGHALAAEHASGALSDHEVIRYIENEAESLLPAGYTLTCQAVYPPRMTMEGVDEDINRRPPDGYAYFVDRDAEEVVEKRVASREGQRTGVSKAEGPRIYRHGRQRSRRRDAA